MVEPQAPPAHRWPALDGLRAGAVLLVVGFHADGLVGHGSLGVDVFFVLSGFLITSLLAAEWDRTGRVDLRRFYRKRLLRLAPALLVVCATVVVLAVLSGSRTREVAEGALASVLYVANLWLYSGHDTPLLQHTWTLALESQFYLLWPLLIPLVLRFRTVGCALLLTSVGLGVAADVVGSGPVAYTYARAVGLPLGCALALVLRRPGTGDTVRRLAALGPASLLLLVVLALVPRAALPVLNGGLAFLPSLLTVPVLACLTRPGPLTGLLARRGPGWLGARSYSLYLWHFPILSIAINQVPPEVPMAVRLVAGVALSVVAAAVSYRYVELPFLRRRPRAPVVSASGS